LLNISLDFRGHRSVTVLRQTGDIMDRNTIEPAIQSIISEIRLKLDEAARIARAAEACVLAGSIAEGITVSMDIEQLVYEAGRLHDAASLLNRLAQG
jgi:hypothetical protein